MVWVCETSIQEFVNSGVKFKLLSDVCAKEILDSSHGRKWLVKDPVVAIGSFRMPVNRSRSTRIA